MNKGYLYQGGSDSRCWEIWDSEVTLKTEATEFANALDEGREISRGIRDDAKNLVGLMGKYSCHLLRGRRKFGGESWSHVGYVSLICLSESQVERSSQLVDIYTSGVWARELVTLEIVSILMVLKAMRVDEITWMRKGGGGGNIRRKVKRLSPGHSKV